MNVIFTDDALEELYETGKTTDRRYKKLCRNKKFIDAYTLVIDTMLATKNTDGLKAYSFLHYEKLKYRHESSVRILNGYVERLIFTEHNNGIEIKLIEIDSDHYGKKR